MATDLKTMFNDLTPGDVISQPGAIFRLLVLKTRGESGKWKHLGRICGNHVHGIPHLFQWSDEENVPINTGDYMIINWKNLQVDKGAAEVLAKKFEDLAVNDDCPIDEKEGLALTNNPNFLKAIEIAHYSNADLGVTIVAMVRALGGTLNDEQAALVDMAMEVHARISYSDHMSSMSDLFGAISGVKH
jgi:hypothetical protein